MRHHDPNANDRFKTRSSGLTPWCVMAAVALHAAVFALVGPFDVEALGATEADELSLVIPPVELPEPPADVPRPAAPLVGDVDLDPSVTLDAPDFDDFLPEPVAPPRTGDAGGSRVRFIPYDTPPVLLDRERVARILQGEYPPRLRSAGVAGTVELWLYVEADGRVTDAEVRRSSGNVALDEAALRVGRQMRFEPALNRDRPTAVWVRQPITFQVRE